MKYLKKDYFLTAEDINSCCEDIRFFAKENKMHNADIIKLVFSVEECLLKYLEHSVGKNTKFRLDLSVRFGRFRMNIFIPGEPFNIISQKSPFDDSYPDIGNLFEKFVLSLTHTYKNGVNCISCEKPINSGNRFVLQFLIAFIVGIGVGFLSLLFPENISQPFDEVLSLISNTIMGLIKMSALPVIFLCTINGICDCGELSAFGKRVKVILSAFFKTIIILLLSTLVLSLLLLKFDYSFSSSSESVTASVFSVLLSLFPDNIILPFSNSDNVKVLFIAILIGCAILTLGSRAKPLSRYIGIFTDISTKIMSWMCSTIPVVIAIMTIQIVRNPSQYSGVITAWQPIVTVLFILFFAMFLEALLVAKKKKLPYKFVLKSIIPASVKGLVTGSTVMVYPDIEKTLSEKLRVEENFLNFSLPLGITFFQPTTVLLASVTLYFAHISCIVISPTWLLTFLLLSFLSGIAIPPVTGGVVAMLSLMFSSLGIDSAYLALGSSLLMLLDYPNTGARVALIILEISRISEKVKIKSKKKEKEKSI